MTDEKQKDTHHEEPQLFEEQPEKKGGRIKGLVVLGLLIGTFLFWPKGDIEGEAVLQAGKFSRIGLTSSGVLKELLHEKGHFVKEGDVIARFENSELLTRFTQQNLLLERLNENKALIEEKVRFYEKEEERKQILHENSVIGRAALEKAKLDSLNASKELIGIKKEIESAEEEMKYLKSRVDSLELKAPFDGVLLTDPSDHVGSPVKEGEFVLEIADPSSYFLEILVPEKEIRRVSVGNKAKVRFHAFSGKAFDGEVKRIAPRTTEEIEKVFKIKHVVPCEIRLHEISENLKYGMRAAVRIKTGRKRGN